MYQYPSLFIISKYIQYCHYRRCCIGLDKCLSPPLSPPPLVSWAIRIGGGVHLTSMAHETTPPSLSLPPSEGVKLRILKGE